MQCIRFFVATATTDLSQCYDSTASPTAAGVTRCQIRTGYRRATHSCTIHRRRYLATRTPHVNAYFHRDVQNRVLCDSPRSVDLNNPEAIAASLRPHSRTTYDVTRSEAAAILTKRCSVRYRFPKQSYFAERAAKINHCCSTRSPSNVIGIYIRKLQRTEG